MIKVQQVYLVLDCNLPNVRFGASLKVCRLAKLTKLLFGMRRLLYFTFVSNFG